MIVSLLLFSRKYTFTLSFKRVSLDIISFSNNVHQRFLKKCQCFPSFFFITPWSSQTLKEVNERVEAGYRMEAPEHCPPAVYSLMRSCWEQEPRRRPTFHKLREKLESEHRNATGSEPGCWSRPLALNSPCWKQKFLRLRTVDCRGVCALDVAERRGGSVLGLMGNTSPTMKTMLRLLTAWMLR